jgi:hypothetical protein
MPPGGQNRPAVRPRLSDRVAIWALTQTYPPALVDTGGCPDRTA